jgi:hypothetical protein
MGDIPLGCSWAVRKFNPSSAVDGAPQEDRPALALVQMSDPTFLSPGTVVDDSIESNYNGAAR